MWQEAQAAGPVMIVLPDGWNHVRFLGGPNDGQVRYTRLRADRHILRDGTVYRIEPLATPGFFEARVDGHVAELHGPETGIYLQAQQETT